MDTPVYEMSFKREFVCAMGDCPNTCCKGWRILFDEETYQRYLAERGKNGLRLRSSIKKMDGEVCFRTSLKSCTFYEKSGLCNLQRTIGTAYMPLICRKYPRFWQNYGAFAEEGLFLSCPQAARLFLAREDAADYVKTDRTADYERWGTNDDGAYLEWLCTLREQMLLLLSEQTQPLMQVLARLNLIMHDVQEQLLHGGELPDITKIMHTHKDCEPLRIDACITDRMMTGGFYHSRLKRVSPHLYRLCRMYFRRFDRLTEAQAQEQADALRRQLYTAYPWMEFVMRRYVAYHIRMCFLEVYEDYSFVRKLGTGIMHVHILELLTAIYADAKKSLTPETLAVLISVYERRGRHNADVSAGMYESLYPALDTRTSFPDQGRSSFQ